MPTVHYFMLADLSRSLLAACLCPLFLLVPGFSLAWLLDLFEFRRRTPAFRAALAVCLSIAVCPIATYLAERSGSALPVWAMYGAAWLYFLLTMARLWPRRPIAIPRAATAVVIVWAVLAMFSLVDLQLGGKDYYSITALDFSTRTALTHSLSAWGVPLRSPFYFPGHPELIRYHYFWMLLVSLVERTAGGVVGPRHAWIAGTVWCGIGLMALVALLFRLPFYQGPRSFRRRAWIGIALLGVTGLDIIPAAFGWILQSGGMMHAVLASIDWWNEQADGFLSTALWAIHYLAGLVTCMTAFLLLWEAARQTAWSGRIRYAAVAGLALASAVGLGIYVAFVFGASLAVWVLVAAVKKWWPAVAACAIAGVVAMAFSAPYLLDLRGGAGGPAGAALQFQVRPFSPAYVLLRSMGVAEWWKLSLANLAMLPLNYFLELGFSLVAARLWWKRRPRPLSPAQLATAVMLATTLSICSFVRSSPFDNNDLGWRGMLVAQFVLLLWAADLVSGPAGAIALPVRRWLAVLALLGAAGSVYDMAILRFYPWMADHGVVSTLGWMTRDRQFGERNYAQREAYEWLDRNTPPQTRIQFNPHVKIQDTAALLYAERQIVAGDQDCVVIFGGNPAFCPPIQAALDRLYPPPGQPAPTAIADACRSLPIDILVANDTDAAWRDPQSWVWKDSPLFANRFVRLFACRPAGTAR
jgi:hypothetical protein